MIKTQSLFFTILLYFSVSVFYSTEAFSKNPILPGTAFIPDGNPMFLNRKERRGCLFMDNVMKELMGIAGTGTMFGQHRSMI